MRSLGFFAFGTFRLGERPTVFELLGRQAENNLLVN